MPLTSEKNNIQNATKRILKQRKPTQLATLQDISKEIIKAFNNLSSAALRHYQAVEGTDPEIKIKQEEIFVVYRSCRERVIVAVNTLQQWCHTLAKQAKPGEKEQFLELAKPYDISNKVGAQIDTRTEPSVIWSDTETEEEEEEVAEMVFDLKSATSLVEPYSGTPSELATFTDSISLLDTITEAADKATMLLFIKTRLRGKARDVANGETTLAGIIARLEATCTDSVNSQTETAKLQAIRQRGANSIAYTAEIQKITDKLCNLHIKEGVPPTTAAKLANTTGVAALIQGIRNPQTRLIMRAGQFNTVADATTKLLMEENSSAEVANILRLATNPSQSSQRGNGQRRTGHNNQNRNYGNRGRRENNFGNNERRRNNNNHNNNSDRRRDNNRNREPDRRRINILTENQQGSSAEGTRNQSNPQPEEYY